MSTYHRQSPIHFSRLPRATAKCVDIKFVRDWIPEEQRRRMDLTNAWVIVRNHYCAALVGRGVCSGICEECREDL